MPRYSASSKQGFLQAIDHLATQVLKNFKQAFSYQSARNTKVILGVMTDVSSRLTGHLNDIADSRYSTKFGRRTADTQIAFHISTHVVNYRDKVGVSVSITESSSTLRLDESELRICCETVERSLRHAVVQRQAGAHVEPADEIAGFVVRPTDGTLHGFEIHRVSKPVPATTSRRGDGRESLWFVSGRMSMRLDKNDAPEAAILLLFSRGNTI